MSYSLSNPQNNQDTIFEIKNRLDIVDVVSEHVVLKKTGRNYSGLCPFHKEKTPSFSVNPDKGIYKCFGCGEGGDAISFLMKINNESFFEVISELAQKYNLQLFSAGNYSEKAELRTKIYELNLEASKYYKNLLVNSQEGLNAKEYLEARKISRDIIENFNLGYSSKQADGLINHLMNKFKPDFDLLEKAGLISKRSTGNGYCDRFRNRIMIPIQDEKGNVIAFGARALDDGQNPKYLNSPDTPVFNKSRSLFALCQAKDSIKKSDSVLIMEGYFDVISAHVQGLTNVVATLGTALTEQHLKILAKYTDSRKIYLAFDVDEAGVSATNRGAEIIRNVFSGLGNIKQFDENFASSININDRTSCEIRVVHTNTGKDPDEFIRSEGIEAYKNFIINAPLLIDYQINRIINSKGKLDNPQAKVHLVKELIPVLAEIKNSIVKDEYTDLIAKRLGVSSESLATEVKKTLQNLTPSRKVNVQPPINKKLEKNLLAQRNLLRLYFLDNGKLSYLCINNYLKEVNFSDPDFLTIKNEIEKLINETQNTEDLIKSLMANLTDKDKAKQMVVDMIISLDDIKTLDEKYLREFILENIQCANQYQTFVEKNKLKSDYHSVKNDEMKALQLQYKVRELVEQSKHRLETANEQKV